MLVLGAINAAHAIPWQKLQSLLGIGSSTQQAGAAKKETAAFDPLAGLGETQPGGNGAPIPPLNAGTMSALIGAQEQLGMSQHQQKVFGKLDSDGDGKVTGAELTGAFGSANQKVADFVMGKLDKDGDGAISKAEFAAGTTRAGRPAAAANSDNAANGNASARSQANLLQQLIRLQAQLTRPVSASTSVATV